MAPTQSRQLLTWTLPTIALLLSYLWYKKKKLGPQSDPSRNCSKEHLAEVKDAKEGNQNTSTEDSKDVQAEEKFSRSLSGVDSAPIDIIIPRELRSQKPNTVVISDEDLDLEIEKIKSMKNTTADPFNKFKSSDMVDNAPRKSPKKIKNTQNLTVNRQESPKDKGASSLTPNSSPKYPKSPKVIKCNPQKIISSSTSPMAQKNSQFSTVQDTFNNIKLDNQQESPKKSTSNPNNTNVSIEHEELQRQSSERDSANHSPADVMLASPSLSSISDHHSEGSNDSGKGGSDVATPPSRTPAGDGSISGDSSLSLIYEFVVPQNLVGRLIGRRGCFIADIKEKTHAHIVIRKHPTSPKMKLCVVEGTQTDIDNALRMVRDKFPAKRYPDMTLEQVCLTPQLPAVSLTPDQLYLKLVEGINNDTIVSCMVAPNHFFLQQPTHPTFPNLNVLSSYMNMCYNSTDSPLLPDPIPENTICVAQSEGDWYRAMVLSTDPETNTSHVIFLDYGGYAYLENSKLRQIRGDFLLLPFQASECVLANIRPAGGSERWPDEAYATVAELTKGALTYTQVAEYTSDGVPLVLMYILTGPQEVVFLNQELVNRGFADWLQTSQADDEEGAVGGIVSHKQEIL